MKILKYLAVAALASATFTAAAADYDALVLQALSLGYGFRADSLRLASEAAAVSAENVLPGPEAEFEHLWPAASDGRVKWNVGLSQGFDWPGLYGARRDLADAAGTLADAASQSMALDRAFAVKSLIVDVINARRRIQLFTRVLENVSRIDSLVAVAYELKDATMLDVRKMNLAVLDSRSQLDMAMGDFESLVASLDGYGIDARNALSWTDYPEQNTAAVDPDSDFGSLAALDAARRASASASERVARLSALPSFSLGFRHAYEEGTHFNGLAVSITLPSWSASSRRRAAELQALAVGADYDAEHAAAVSETRGVYSLSRTLAESMERYRALIGNDDYLTLAAEVFDSGEMTVIEYVTEVNNFFAARLRYLDLEYRYQLALVRLNRYRTALFR